MARVIAVGSQKGGVGKTTTVLNLGYSLSRLGQRVLLVDADPQCGMSIATNLNQRVVSGLVQVLRGGVHPLTAVAYSRDRTLAGLNSGVATPEDAFFFEGAGREGRFGPVLRAYDTDFDYILIDAPAGVGGIVHGVLAASHAVILVVRCQTILIKSLPVFLKAVQHTRETSNPELRLLGALLTMRNTEDPLDEQLCRELTESFPPAAFFKAQIALDPVYELASQKAVPVARLKRMVTSAQTAAQAYMDLALELRERDNTHRVGVSPDEDAEGLF